MSRRTGVNPAAALLCIILLAIGFGSGYYVSRYLKQRNAAGEHLEMLRRISDLKVASAFMDRLLVVKDESAQYNNIRLVLSVPVSISYSADMGKLVYQKQEDGSFLITLPPITREEARYDIVRAVNLDLTTGFGQTSTWANFQDMYALFAQSVEDDRKALDKELEKGGYPAGAEDALRRHILSFAEAWGIVVNFSTAKD